MAALSAYMVAVRTRHRALAGSHVRCSQREPNLAPARFTEVLVDGSFDSSPDCGRVTISMPLGFKERVDEAARRLGITRSGLFVRAAEVYMGSAGARGDLACPFCGAPYSVALLGDGWAVARADHRMGCYLGELNENMVMPPDEKTGESGAEVLCRMLSARPSAGFCDGRAA